MAVDVSLVESDDTPERGNVFRDLVELASDAIFVADGEGRYQYANRAACRLLGYTAEELLQLRVSDVIAPHDQARLKRTHQDVADGLSDMAEWDLVRKDGRHVRVEVHTNMLPDGRWHAIVRDLTELRQREAEYRLHRQILRNSTEVADVGTWYIDLRTGKREWSPRMRELFGFAPEDELTLEANAERIHPEDRERILTMFPKTAAEGKRFRDTYRVVLPSGEVRWLLTVGGAEYDSNGDAVAYLGSCLDITETKLQEQELARSEALYRSLSDALPLMAWRNGPDGQMEFASKSWMDYTGAEQEKNVQLNWRTYVHPSDLPAIMPSREMGLERSEAYSCWARIRNLRGEYRWHRVRVVPSFTEGKLTHWTGTAMDVHDLQMAREEAELNEQRYKLLAELQPGFLWSSSPDGRVDFFNERWLAFTGLSLEDVLGDGWTKALHPDDAQETKAAWAAAVGSNKEFLVEHRLRRHDGVYHTFLTRALPLQSPTGGILRWIGTSIDIQVMKDTAAALRESDELLKLATETAGVGIWRFNLATRERIWSDRMREIYGFSPDEELDDTMSRIHPDDVLRIMRIVDEARANPKEFRFDYRVVWPNGEVHWLWSLGGVSTDASGKATELYGCVLDISERKQLEEVLRGMNVELEARVRERTLELERANQELEGFTYSVAHDLRAPIRTLVSTSAILGQDYSDHLPADGLALMERQQLAAQRLGHLIDDLLQLSKIGRAELRKTEFDLTALARVAAEECNAEAGRVHVEDGLTAEGDPDLIRLVLVNLIGNALKFSPPDRAVEVFGTEDAFAVRDLGIGFDMQYLHKLFRPFERLVNDSEYPGTGIGLANVKRIVERHGGQVWAEAEPGQGATFYFTLP